VTLVSNAEEAFTSYQEKAYDIVFMDIQMSIMDGLEASKLILDYEENTDKKHVPIIALTADIMPGDKEKYNTAGMDDYATKPLDLEVLTKIISRYCTS